MFHSHVHNSLKSEFNVVGDVFHVLSKLSCIFNAVIFFIYLQPKGTLMKFRFIPCGELKDGQCTWICISVRTVFHLHAFVSHRYLCRDNRFVSNVTRLSLWFTLRWGFVSLPGCCARYRLCQEGLAAPRAAVTERGSAGCSER